MAKCSRCGKSGVFLKVNQSGICIDCERNENLKIINDLSSRLSPEQNNIIELQKEIEELNKQKFQLQNIIQQQIELQNQRQNNIKELDNIIEQKKLSIVNLDDAILVQEFGLYEPKYDFCNSEDYKMQLDIIRQKQKDMIKNSTAVTGRNDWMLNGDKAKGRKMIKDMQKLLLRAFNDECEQTIEKVRYSNFEQSKKRIVTSCEAISKLGSMMGISITRPFFDLKINELTLAFEYQIKKQTEKEEQRELKERMREEARVQKELEEARKKITKEQNHYQNALEKVKAQLLLSPDDVDLLNKLKDIENNISDIEKALNDIDYREANKRAGYVYVISNIGAFGENVYKIGMTRRLEPQDRIDELGDASVPFKFDVHAMIFSDDAPALETALHHAFENKRINMVNPRREFFRVSLDEIKDVVKKNYEKTAEFIEIAQAEQYRISEKMRAENQQ